MINEVTTIIPTAFNKLTTPSSLSRTMKVAIQGKNITRTTLLTTNCLALNASVAFFSEEEYERAAKVAVLGSDVAETLFSETSLLGKKIRMGDMIVTVIGVLESKGGMMNSSDDAVFIPLTLLQQAVSQTRTAQGEKVVSSITLTVAEEQYADQVEADITSLLRTRHRLETGADDDFNIQSMSDIVETLSEASGTMTLLF